MTTSKAIVEIIVLIATACIVRANPSCLETGEFKDEITCTAGNRNYVLSRGLVSDNERTKRITLKQCRITDINSEAFHNLYSLKHLDLSNNNIQELRPRVFDGANNITHLILSHNMITEISLGFFEDLPFIELLDLKGNKINALKEGLFDPLSRIGHLDLSSNLFTGQSLSTKLFANNPWLGFLDFSGIDMSDAPNELLHSLKRIDFLNIAGCSLTEVPKFATNNLKSMKRLSMLANNINSLSDPNAFVNLENLEMLNLESNAIDTIHGNIFKSQNRLKTVILKNNRLKKIPTTLFTNKFMITKIDLANNLIEFIPTEAFLGTSVDTLDLSGNRFSFLPDKFLTSLANNGATLAQFTFSKNPWQCACLKEVLNEVKSLHVEYNSDEFSGSKPVCVIVTSSFVCDRDPTHNKLYVREYVNLLNRS